MNYSFEYIDIILLAMIAGFIFLRLRGILGKRTGFEGKAPPEMKEVLKNINIPQAKKVNEKFDDMATVTNFVIVPLSFLSGTFYSIERLPEVLQIISKANPFFYMIDGFRYSFIGKADGSIFTGLVYLSVLSFVSWFVTYLLYKKGYKIKS